MQPTSIDRLSLVDLARKGLDAHLRQVVINQIIQETLEEFHQTLRVRLEKQCRDITLGHIQQVRNFLKMREELDIDLVIRFDEGDDLEKQA